MNEKIQKLLTLITILACILLFPDAEVFAQWETLHQGSNLNNSPGDYYVEGDTLILFRKGGGLKISEDGGETWNEEPINPMDNGNEHAFHFKFKDAYYIRVGYTGTNNFARSADSLSKWEYPSGLPQSGAGDNRGIAQAATNGEIAFLHTWTYLDSNNDEVTDYLVSDSGDDWVRIGDAIDYGKYTFIGDDLYATAGNAIVMSADTGKTWTEVSVIADSLKIKELYSGSNTLYAQAWYETDDYTETIKFALVWNMDENEWEVLHEANTYLAFGMDVKGDKVAVGIFNESIYYSSDGGESWLNVSIDEFNVYTVFLDGEYLYATGPGSGFGNDFKRMPLSGFQELTSNENNAELPTRLKLNQNYPNPFNPTTNISYAIDQSGFTQLRIFDITGREIAVLVDGFRMAGSHEVSADLSGFSSGMYFYQLSLNGQTQTRKMTLLK